MTVTTGNTAILIMDAQFCALMATDLAGTHDGVALSVMVAASAFRASAFDVPAAVRIGDYVMGFWAFAHGWLPLFVIKIRAYKVHYSEHNMMIVIW